MSSATNNQHPLDRFISDEVDDASLFRLHHKYDQVKAAHASGNTILIENTGGSDVSIPVTHPQVQHVPLLHPQLSASNYIPHAGAQSYYE